MEVLRKGWSIISSCTHCFPVKEPLEWLLGVRVGVQKAVEEGFPYCQVYGLQGLNHVQKMQVCRGCISGMSGDPLIPSSLITTLYCLS